MLVSYNRVEYLESEINIDEVVLKDEFNGDVEKYIQYYEDEYPESITRINVFDVKIELL